jgi:ABC-type transport system involved in multi-copper enzyme maturation permease subunit
LITGIKSAITKTVVDVALWVLGTILSIVIGLSLFSSQARFDADTLHFVYDVKFTVLGRFVVAVFLIIISLIIISVKIPPIIAIIITVPAIITFIALIISITVYVILASAAIDYMQLARNNQGEN